MRVKLELKMEQIWRLIGRLVDAEGLATGYIDVWEHFGGDRHIDADWSPIIEGLYSSELDFMDICAIILRDFTVGNPLGCRGSACVEVMTTLHGSAPSFRRCAEGCVPSEGMIASTRDPLKSISLLFRATLVLSIDTFGLGSTSWIRVRGRLIRESDRRSDQRDMDSQIVIIDQFVAAMTSIQEAIASLGWKIDGQHAQRRLRHLGTSDEAITWEDFDGAPVASLSTKIMMPEIERYIGIGCPRIHLRLYSMIMRAHGLDEAQMVMFFLVPKWCDTMLERVKGIETEVERLGHLIYLPLEGEDFTVGQTSGFYYSQSSRVQYRPRAPHQSYDQTQSSADLCFFCFEDLEAVFIVGYAIEPSASETHRGRIVDGSHSKPLPRPIPPWFRMNLHYAYHKWPGHETDRYTAMRHAIQDLIDQSVDHLSRVTLGPQMFTPFRLVPEATSVQTATVEPLTFPHYSVQTPFVFIPDVDEVQTPYIDDAHTSVVQYVIPGRRIDSSLEPNQSRDYHHPRGIDSHGKGHRVPSVLLDNGSTLNVCPLATAIALDYEPFDFGPST
ncbi:hypothetical protein CK203_037839 [Vitis vinifera]|uniref:Uncharacterized protein n=1 Tax=Vitis vinifera TaxID=29760 RepID=A0A438IC65_VITVI|nr:hypothetical protein CK203_037839 [Vitis vinifera]